MSSHNKEARRAWELVEILNAQRFCACMFVGFHETGNAFERRFASTLDEARRYATALHRKWGDRNFRRGVLIYAITHTQMSLYVETVPCPRN